MSNGRRELPPDEQPEKPEIPPPPEAEVVHHYHHYDEQPDVYRREPPVNRDPLATYDFLFRKQPKRLGFLEFTRSIPGFLGQFPGRVPEDRLTIEADGSQVIFECVCGEVVQATFNRIEDCPGECGRIFAFTGSRVCVHGTPEKPEQESEVSEVGNS
jgi:hypothetical protein